MTDSGDALEQYLAQVRESELRARSARRWMIGIVLAGTIFTALLAWSVHALTARRNELQVERNQLEVDVDTLQKQKHELIVSGAEQDKHCSEVKEGYVAEQQKKDDLQTKLDDVRKAVDVPQSQPAAITQVKQVLGAPPGPSARDLWLQGYRAYLAGNRDAAKASYEQALAIDPKYAPALNSLGRVAADNHDANAERDYYKRALDADPNYVPALTNMASLELAANNLDEAKRLATKANTLKPGSGKTLLDQISAARGPSKM